jgi:CRISPR-associated protein Csy2
MEEILIIRNIRVYGVSAQQNSIVIGSPSPTAYCGASVKLCRNTGMEYDGTAVVVHGFELDDGHGKFVPHEPDQKSASTTDIRTGTLDVTLLIRVKHDFDEKDELRRNIRRNLRNIAGGRIVNPPDIEDIILVTEDEALKEIRTNSSGEPVRGALMIDRSDLLVGSVDPLNTMLTLLNIPEEGEAKPVKGWLVPIHIGFQGIEPPINRPCDRKKLNDTTPHSFAECITSMGEYVSIRRIKTLQNSFWCYYHNASERTYYVSAR